MTTTDVTLSPAAAKRIQAIGDREGRPVMLRVAVEGGGFFVVARTPTGIADAYMKGCRRPHREQGDHKQGDADALAPDQEIVQRLPRRFAAAAAANRFDRRLPCGLCSRPCGQG